MVRNESGSTANPPASALRCSHARSSSRFTSGTRGHSSCGPSGLSDAKLLRGIGEQAEAVARVWAKKLSGNSLGAEAIGGAPVRLCRNGARENDHAISFLLAVHADKKVALLRRPVRQTPARRAGASRRCRGCGTAGRRLRRRRESASGAVGRGGLSGSVRKCVMR